MPQHGRNGCSWVHTWRRRRAHVSLGETRIQQSTFPSARHVPWMLVWTALRPRWRQNCTVARISPALQRQNIDYTPIVWISSGRLHRDALTILLTLVTSIARERNVASVDAVCQRLHSSITRDMRKLTARQRRTCWPWRPSHGGVSRAVWPALRRALPCLHSGLAPYLSQLPFSRGRRCGPSSRPGVLGLRRSWSALGTGWDGQLPCPSCRVLWLSCCVFLTVCMWFVACRDGRLSCNRFAAEHVGWSWGLRSCGHKLGLGLLFRVLIRRSGCSRRWTSAVSSRSNSVEGALSFSSTASQESTEAHRATWPRLAVLSSAASGVGQRLGFNPSAALALLLICTSSRRVWRLLPSRDIFTAADVLSRGAHAFFQSVATLSNVCVRGGGPAALRPKQPLQHKPLKQTLAYAPTPMTTVTDTILVSNSETTLRTGAGELEVVARGFHWNTRQGR